ncbi:adenylate/guanylate cyclase domain-containing protein [Paenarthrobacter sp. NPDC089675]|uniref:adenylate/guanylate cyclase domain-containing protein n=1 Tax=Paenarthrobacter sp. NPDC089675 TaxID=3364376 RepID=UPI003827EB98
MTVLSDKIATNAKTLWTVAWNERTGQVVPSTDEIAHSNGAVKVEATYLYADLADSTEMQKLYGSDFAARVHRMYLGGACEVIRAQGGEIRSFDGDRVMGIFMGKRMRNDATSAALKINWVVCEVINKLTINRKRSNGDWWKVSHGVGIDSGEALIVRAGVRNRPGGSNHNDLISIGAAPAIAAKLSGLRNVGGATIVTDNVYRYLQDSTKLSTKDKTNMFKGPQTRDVDPYKVTTYTSSWWTRP